MKRKKKKYQVWQAEFSRTALDPKEDGEESRGNNEGSCNWSIVCNNTKKKTQNFFCELERNREKGIDVCNVILMGKKEWEKFCVVRTETRWTTVHLLLLLLSDGHERRLALQPVFLLGFSVCLFGNVELSVSLSLSSYFSSFFVFFIPMRLVHINISLR